MLPPVPVLSIVLAVLVALGKVDQKKAEYIVANLKYRKVPSTFEGIVDEIKEVVEEYE